MWLDLREGDRWYEERPSGRALFALVYLRRHPRLELIAARFRINIGTHHAQAGPSSYSWPDGCRDSSGPARGEGAT